METLRDLDLVRAVAPTVAATEMRASDDGMPTMVVRFSRFDVWYEIDSFWEGRFLERTVRGAFTKTLREQGAQMKIQFDHGHDPQIGSKLLGKPRSWYEADDSPVVEVDLFDASYVRDLIPGLEAGVYGSSFRFRVMREEWVDEPGRSEHNPDGIPERTLKELRVLESGPVTWPANPDSTAGLRSLTDDFYARMRSRDPHHVEALEARMRAIRTPDAGAALLGTPAEGAASTTDDAPAPCHPSGLSSAARSRILTAPFLI
ncbi:MAG TPA: HK97 family phage prohead protease [Armatimonadota bacterium]|nr:HK97 family phage prohead protease [Armatimonadota bacterium]